MGTVASRRATVSGLSAGYRAAQFWFCIGLGTCNLGYKQTCPAAVSWPVCCTCYMRVLFQRAELVDGCEHVNQLVQALGE